MPRWTIWRDAVLADPRGLTIDNDSPKYPHPDTVCRDGPQIVGAFISDLNDYEIQPDPNAVIEIAAIFANRGQWNSWINSGRPPNPNNEAKRPTIITSA